ncbi:hypothetical protein [Pseudomonas coronafaciens]|uniref:hypothetical protein n=1 Tax=Pseudomonas coronafaciens TaxID=53409 RepID=UPI000EFEFA24|nr:hypothetical protein [Pseudomonas coronafaciens]RMV68076.1 hypothetical protein ALP06_03994 [Pseudomonas coronafaciens pv. atropurpurea]
MPPRKSRLADSLTSEAVWDQCVAMLLGPKSKEHRDKRTSQALHMAAAALRAAGEPLLAKAVRAAQDSRV